MRTHPLFLLSLAFLLFGCTSDTEAPAPGADADAVPVSAESAAPPSAPAQETAAAPAVSQADLDRYYGVYGDADNPGRDFFVAEARPNPDMEREIPPGFLIIGAMWGDVAPWYMEQVSETRFEQRWVSDFQDEPLVAVFELGEDGEAVALTFETMFEDRGRLERTGDLPERWQ